MSLVQDQPHHTGCEGVIGQFIDPETKPKDIDFIFVFSVKESTKSCQIDESELRYWTTWNGVKTENQRQKTMNETKPNEMERQPISGLGLDN